MGRFRVCFSLAVILVVAGCTPPAPLDFSQNEVPVSNSKIKCKLQSVAVTVENVANYGNGAYGDRPTKLTEFRAPFQDALQDGLDRSAVFDYSSPNYCAVEAKILGLKQAQVSITFPVELFVWYTIEDLNSGKPLVSEVVEGRSSTPFSYNMFAIIRLRHSLIGSGIDAVHNTIISTEQYAASKQ